MYMQELQNMREVLDNKYRQAQQYQQSYSTGPQPTAINQTFQLSNPQQNVNDFDGKYAQNIDEIKNTLTLKNTLFLNKEMSFLWLKDISGNIKTYSLTEVIELDEKDKEIEALKKELKNMKEMLLNDKSINADANKSITSSEPTGVSTNK